MEMNSIFARPWKSSFPMKRLWLLVAALSIVDFSALRFFLGPEIQHTYGIAAVALTPSVMAMCGSLFCLFIKPFKPENTEEEKGDFLMAGLWFGLAIVDMCLIAILIRVR
jgi:hypothetical protein